MNEEFSLRMVKDQEPNDISMIIQAIHKVKEKPKSIFILDGFGALLSAFLLGVVLVRLEDVFGIPSQVLYFLAFWPICFAIYDGYAYLKSNNNLGAFLKGIAIMNLLYCCLSIALAIYHKQQLTEYGWIYVLVEVAIIIALANWELRLAKEHYTSYGIKNDR